MFIIVKPLELHSAYLAESLSPSFPNVVIRRTPPRGCEPSAVSAPTCFFLELDLPPHVAREFLSLYDPPTSFAELRAAFRLFPLLLSAIRGGNQSLC